ncbi:hypothetical protein F3Y22_tig00116954pilonHSYRG00153 [Hibiscus syriacus]|uniref:Selenoprotein O n=1 Tax=Hibiscus syriacus TaxID=106335 RepID=A0A6A2WXS4_HIBSY|nr:hypothetical protein F3Y22_tig00116954pilonHSYRG00153 [Hibiscus syriacus]
MDSSSPVPPSALSVDFVADGLKKQSLSEHDNNNKKKSVKLSLEDLNWDHSFVRELPGDPRSDSIPRQVFHSCYTKILPSAEVENPKLVAWSDSAAELLDLDPKEFERPDFPLKFSGASPLAGAVSYAQCYGGHQFGTWAGQLGDGRAITLGEILNSKLESGNPKDEPGSVVCRVSQSFLRFGSYQIHGSRGGEDLGIVRSLADYAIRHHFPHIENMSKSESLSLSPGDNDQSVVDLTSNKYAGLTIDYGPFGFLDSFDPSYTPNTTDLPGRRYCFANQPDIGLWNIARFASTLMAADLISDKEANYAMEKYGTKFMDEYQAILSQKLGLQKYNKQLVNKLLGNLAVDKVDYTNFFRALSNIKADPGIPVDELLVPLKSVLLDIGKERKEAWTDWVQSYIQELVPSGISDEERKASMDSVNPKYVLRNYLCQSAIDAAEMGDFEEVRRLLKVMERPYDEQPGMEKYARLPPAWAYRPGVCMLSCSS